jgi:hypothetical protein
MTDLALQRHYSELSGEERFRLILAASGRGDTVEKERLSKAAHRIELVTPDHAPASFGFNNLSLMTYIELLDAAGFYREVMTMEEHEEDLKFEREWKGRIEEMEDDEEEYVPLDVQGLKPDKRSLGMTLAAGCILREKARGWVLFCERIGVPPFLLWDDLPGYDRLKRDMDIAETFAFSREALLRWCNRKEEPGEQKIKEVISAEQCAVEAELLYRKQVEWWGGA